MNLRQKAKRFKKLYEESLPKKPYPVVHSTTSLKHYKVQQSIDSRDILYIQDDLQIMKSVIENRILQELRPLIFDNLIVEHDLYTDTYRYSLDIWMKDR